MRDISNSPFLEIQVLESREMVDMLDASKILEVEPLSCYISPDGSIHSGGDGNPKRDAPSFLFVARQEQSNVYVQMNVSALLLFPAIKEVLEMIKKDEIWKELL